MTDPLQTILTETAAIRAELEQKRQRYWQIYTMGVPMAFAIICAIAAMNTDHGEFPWPIVAVITCGVALVGFQVLNALYRRLTKLSFLDKIAKALGLTYAPKGLFNPSDINHHQILPNYDIQRFEDGFGGTVNGVPLAFEEAWLTERIRNPNRQQGQPEYEEHLTFWGLIIRIGIGKHLEAHTIVMPRNKIERFFRTTLSQYKPVNLVSPKFEEKFDTIGTDQVEARYVLDPAFMERFMEAQALANTKWLSASFQGNEIAIALQRFKPMFEIGALWRSLTEDSLQSVIAELLLILRMIETLKLNPHTGLGAVLPVKDL